jgi:hypothetical protein
MNKIFKLTGAFLALVIAGSGAPALAQTCSQTPPRIGLRSFYANPHPTQAEFRQYAINLGYQVGRAVGNSGTNTSTVTIFACGAPIQINGAWGVSTWRYNWGHRQLTNFEASEGTINYAYGIWYGLRAAGDTTSRVDVVMGTSNYEGVGQDVGAAHGVNWAGWVWRVDLDLQQLTGSNQVRIFGGWDVENDGSLWGTAPASIAWASGYDSMRRYLGGPALANFGAAIGCPTSGTNGVPGQCNSRWTQADFVEVTWIKGQIALPQIYNNTFAKQWQQLALHAFLNPSYRKDVYIHGPLTQQLACQYRPSDQTCPTFSPLQGWNALCAQLNSDPRTAESMRYPTDIGWMFDVGY